MSRPLSLAAILVAAAFAASPAGAQQQTMRVVGTIEGVDGPTLVIKQRQGGEVKVNVGENAKIFGVAKSSMADLKAGMFVGVGAMPQADGSQRAVQISIFADSLRGAGEGHRPWSSTPGGTMTNATVDTAVTGVDGQVLMVKYKDGEKKIVVGSDAVIRAYIDGTRSELKPGANIVILRADKKPDGTLETARVDVGRDGFVP